MPNREEQQRSSHSKVSTEANVATSKLLFSGNETSVSGTNLQASGERPQRSNRGKGGAREQLAAIGERIRPDLNPGVKRQRTKAIPDDVLVNPMAPPAKQRRGVYS